MTVTYKPTNVVISPFIRYSGTSAYTIGVIDSLCVPTLSVSRAAPQLPLTIPVATVRERNQTPTRAGIYNPHSAGIFVQNKKLSASHFVTQSFFMIMQAKD